MPQHHHRVNHGDSVSRISKAKLLVSFQYSFPDLCENEKTNPKLQYKSLLSL